jgi:hypothetical protein
VVTIRRGQRPARAEPATGVTSDHEPPPEPQFPRLRVPAAPGVGGLVAPLEPGSGAGTRGRAAGAPPRSAPCLGRSGRVEQREPIPSYAVPAA